MSGPRRRSPRREAVAYFGGGSESSVSRRLICVGALPKAVERLTLRRLRRVSGGAGLMRQPHAGDRARAVPAMAVRRAGFMRLREDERVGPGVSVARPGLMRFCGAHAPPMCCSTSNGPADGCRFVCPVDSPPRSRSKGSPQVSPLIAGATSGRTTRRERETTIDHEPLAAAAASSHTRASRSPAQDARLGRAAGAPDVDHVNFTAALSACVPCPNLCPDGNSGSRRLRAAPLCQ